MSRRPSDPSHRNGTSVLVSIHVHYYQHPDDASSLCPAGGGPQESIRRKPGASATTKTACPKLGGFRTPPSCLLPVRHRRHRWSGPVRSGRPARHQTAGAIARPGPRSAPTPWTRLVDVPIGRRIRGRSQPDRRRVERQGLAAMCATPLPCPARRTPLVRSKTPGNPGKTARRSRTSSTVRRGSNLSPRNLVTLFPTLLWARSARGLVTLFPALLWARSVRGLIVSSPLGEVRARTGRLVPASPLGEVRARTDHLVLFG